MTIELLSSDARSELRKRTLKRFEHWLDEALASEEPPEGIAAELLAEAEESVEPDRRTDLFSMWSAMTALSQEVKLQGRAFKQLAETVEPIPQLGVRIESSLAEHRDAIALTRRVIEARREEQAAAERRAQRPLIDVLVDMRERMARGLAPVQAYLRRDATRPPPSWLARVLGAGETPSASAAMAALEEGCRLGLDRLEETLQGLGVEEIECVGQPFDPHTMTAMEVVRTHNWAEDGNVLEVYRAGYRWGGDLLRPARVRVARAAGPLERG